MKSIVILILCSVSLSVYSQDTLDLPTKREKEIVDSLSKVYNRKVVGFTKIGNTMTNIQYIKNNREYDLSLVGFRLETLSPQFPNRPTNRTIYPHGNR
jgi:hypothetical protein